MVFCSYIGPLDSTGHTMSTFAQNADRRLIDGVILRARTVHRHFSDGCKISDALYLNILDKTLTKLDSGTAAAITYSMAKGKTCLYAMCERWPFMDRTIATQILKIQSYGSDPSHHLESRCQRIFVFSYIMVFQKCLCTSKAKTWHHWHVCIQQQHIIYVYMASSLCLIGVHTLSFFNLGG